MKPVLISAIVCLLLSCLLYSCDSIFYDYGESPDFLWYGTLKTNIARISHLEQMSPGTTPYYKQYPCCDSTEFFILTMNRDNTFRFEYAYDVVDVNELDSLETRLYFSDTLEGTYVIDNHHNPSQDFRCEGKPCSWLCDIDYYPNNGPPSHFSGFGSYRNGQLSISFSNGKWLILPKYWVATPW
ncbi:hypothetical protein ACFLU5_02780 [Bacteroidota bacterium]